MDYQGQQGQETNKVEEYGEPVAGHAGVTVGPRGMHGGVTAAAAGTGGAQVQPLRDDHKTDGVLRRSGSSSSSSSEDDGVGGRRKKGVKGKIKEKLPGAHKDDPQAAAAPDEYARPHGAEATGEKKGVMDKIKEKLSGEQH